MTRSTNVVWYGRVAAVEAASRTAMFRVRDNEMGLPIENSSGGHGFGNLPHRAPQLSAFEIGSVPDGGTELRGSLPARRFELIGCSRPMHDGHRHASVGNTRKAYGAEYPAAQFSEAARPDH